MTFEEEVRQHLIQSEMVFQRAIRELGNSLPDDPAFDLFRELPEGDGAQVIPFGRLRSGGALHE